MRILPQILVKIVQLAVITVQQILSPAPHVHPANIYSMEFVGLNVGMDILKILHLGYVRLVMLDVMAVVLVLLIVWLVKVGIFWNL